MRLLLLLVVLLAVVSPLLTPSLLHPQATVNERGDRKESGTSKGQVQPELPATVASKGDQGRSGDEGAQRGEPTQYEKDVLASYRSVACATWFLVYATGALVVIGVIIGGLQASLMSRQVAVAQSLVNLERPWIAARVTQNDIGRAVRKNESTMSVEVSLSNYGRSPAWVVESFSAFELMKQPLPREPPYGDARKWDRLPIPVRDVVPLLRSARGLTPEMCEQFRHWYDDRECLVVFGFVRYMIPTDEQVHELRFCWTYFNRQEPAGPPAWRGSS